MNDYAIEDAIKVLDKEMLEKEKRTVLSFGEFLKLAKKKPDKVFRNIFQVLGDMRDEYIGEGVDEYPDDPESINFVKFDCSQMFGGGSVPMFRPDRLFANRFNKKFQSLAKGAMQNKLYNVNGASGCGKSTFLDAFLESVEAYTDTESGRIYETVWRIQAGRNEEDTIEVPCPSHDYPLLVLPQNLKKQQNYRRIFLDQLLENNELKHKIFTEKEYEWLFRWKACPICKRMFLKLFDKLGSIKKVFGMIYARAYEFDRMLGEGISVLNPGDKPMKETIFKDGELQKKLDKYFGSSNAVKYFFSSYAKTNNGILALADIKFHNEDRLVELHNIISEGVRKVDCYEENVRTFFITLMCPEDQKIFKERKLQSFEGRMEDLKIPFVLEPETEVEIYRDILGKYIDDLFLPRVLKNWARVIVASRMNTRSDALERWIPEAGDKYKKYCDGNGQLLRMEIYSGIKPAYLSEEDKKSFTAKHRKAIINEAENEGDKGFSGRQSIRLFKFFLDISENKGRLINMDDVCDFFKLKIDKKERDDKILKGFLGSLLNWYDYTVIDEIKEALYFYNEDRIKKDVVNFLFASSYFGEWGLEVSCPFTKEKIEITKDFFEVNSLYISGDEIVGEYLQIYLEDRDGIADRYNQQVISQGIHTLEDVFETEIFKDLFEQYTYNKKEKVLEPFKANKNFPVAIKVYGEEEFKTFDKKIREHVAHMMQNLCKNGYTEQGAKEICVYVIDNELLEKFS